MEEVCEDMPAGLIAQARRFAKADKLQLTLRVLMRARGIAWKLYVRVAMRSPQIGSGTYCIGWPRLTHRNGKLVVGDSCFLGAGVFKVTEGAEIRIGDRVLINNGFVISANELIEIGADSLIGEYVSIRDADHAFSRRDIPISLQGFTSAPIRIGEDVWIGRGAVILKGIEIGRGAVIGANSVVTHDVAPYDIVVGAPARRVRSRPQ
jgi:acetyltransferase-like isoleucine patch superfamily enzyme